MYGIAITDVPPGTSCPMVKVVKNSDLCLLVTESTLSGIHDLERVLGVCRHFSVPTLVCINKHNINENNTRQIERYYQKSQEVGVAAKIPFDNVVTEALVHGLPVVEYSQYSVAIAIARLWQVTAKALA